MRLTKKQREEKELFRSRNAMLVKALRGNKYKQGRGKLINTRKYMCCLGVACDLFMQNNETNMGWSKDRSAPGLEDSGEFNKHYPPEKVCEWFGWEVNDPELKLGKNNKLKTSKASLCNDELKMNFKQIANAFERTFVKTEE